MKILKKMREKVGFTLMEVNLAIFIMAGGVLAMVSLYSLGFRESSQSAEDVASAAIASTVLDPLVAMLSSPDITWDQWKQLPYNADSQGTSAGGSNGDKWSDYGRTVKDTENGSPTYNQTIFLIDKSKVQSLGYQTAQKIINAIRPGLTGNTRNRADGAPADPRDNQLTKLASSVIKQQYNAGDKTFYWAMVASRPSEYSPVISLAIHVVRKGNEAQLLSQPLYYTEVCFQGKK